MPDPTENEDLHVVITAPNSQALKNATTRVKKLLVPVDDSMNLHKQQQLKELAILNGTYKGDRQGDDRLDRWKQIREEHDKYKAKALPAEAMAAYGRQLGNGAAANPALDQEYKAFMSEIGGGPGAGAATGGAPAQPPPGGAPMQMPQMQMGAMGGMRGPPMMGGMMQPGMMQPGMMQGPPPGWAPPGMAGPPQGMIPRGGPPMPMSGQPAPPGGAQPPPPSGGPPAPPPS